MSIARTAQKCPKCGESYKGIYADRGKNFVGDTFIRWDKENHICRLGILYFIERIDNNQWFGSRGFWTNDPMKAKAFKQKESAEDYLKMSLDIPPRLHCIVSEHEFIT